MTKDIDFNSLEKKWQKKWEEKKVFEVKDNPKKKKYYVLEMFPYPSGEGLHMGHALNYTIGDIYARFKRMSGFNVLYPMGYDAFGLPAENAAIKAGKNPKEYTEKAMANFMMQQKSLGISYDWAKMVVTCYPEYYKWNQYFFTKFFEAGLVYKKKSAANWCPKCDTVLANEQAQGGKCWIHKDTDVEIRHLDQWFIKTTKYADELLEKVKDLKWPNRIKTMQENWIGKSHGTEIDFKIENSLKNINCIIVHGCPSSAEKAMDVNSRTFDKHWIPWIRKKLEEKDIKVITPMMPEPWKADYNNWKKEIDKLDVNENTVLIGHSCGCAFLVRWLGETKRQVKKLILVAPWKVAESGNASKAFYNYNIDENIKNRVKDIVIFTSNDEEDDGKKSVNMFNEFLDGEIIELKNKGHYTFDDMGSAEFPELLNNILSETWQIFTTRPDTIYGVTFMVISAQHPRLMELVTSGQKKEVEAFLKKLKSVSEKELEEMDKEGVFTGSYAINPVTGDKIPVWAGNFVVADYGAGMVMAVPTHDQRDFEFAKKYKIPMKVVIQPDAYELSVEKMSRAFTSDGRLVNSGEFDGWSNREAIDAITEFLDKKKVGRKVVQYKLRDWLVSRQRYWGTPIPIIYCDKCGAVTVPEKDLPVLLPEKVKFGSGNPLATSKEFLEVKCPKCNGKARRETDTMDTFFDSSWYYLRYPDNLNKKEAFDKKKIAYWLPVDYYIGGAEHACMHLIYARFFTKALRDLGYLKFDEPFTVLFNQGMLHAADGNKMSKSLGNVVNPIEMIDKYSADSLRLTLMSLASPDSDSNWNDRGLEAMFKWTKKVFEVVSGIKKGKSSKRLESKINKIIKEITEDIEEFRYNLAIIKLRQLFDVIEEQEEMAKADLESFVKLLSVFCPHIAEEIWEKIGGKGFVSLAEWPKSDEKKIDVKMEEAEKSAEKTVEDILNILKIIKEKSGKEAEKVYLYVIPNELGNYRADTLSKRTLKEVKVYAVNDKAKYDPEGKAGKAKPGRPAVYVQ